MRNKETSRLTITAIFAAILILQTFVPNIGYVRILPTLPAITTIPLTITIYSSLMGPRAGTYFGVFWGLTRLVVAYTQPGDMVSLLLFQNPLISLIPSIFAGFLPGLIVKKLKQNKASYILAGAVASLINTILVIGLTSILFMNNSGVLLKNLGGSSNQALIIVLIAALGLNGIIEAIFTAIVTPIIVLPLKKVFSRLAL